METVSSLAARYVLSQLHQLQRSRPLFVAMQGPQGSGKTHLTRSLVSTLSSAPHSLRVVVFSVDDLYLTHSGLVDLAERHPGNMLWKGRGQPGTHDVKLGADILEQLRDLNIPPKDRTVTLPIFDKSKFNGEGDRLSEGVKVEAPIDIVILEGWCMGFYPLDEETLQRKWDSVLSESDGSFGNDLDIVRRAMKGISREDIEQVNEALRGYAEHWYPRFQAFIQIKPPEHSPFEYIYKWRLQQEHSMKAANGGFGMTDEQVVKFVDRYIPGYVFFGFGSGVESGGSRHDAPWKGRRLCIVIDENRQPLDTKQY